MTAGSKKSQQPRNATQVIARRPSPSLVDAVGAWRYPSHVLGHEVANSGHAELQGQPSRTGPMHSIRSLDRTTTTLFERKCSACTNIRSDKPTYGLNDECGRRKHRHERYLVDLSTDRLDDESFYSVTSYLHLRFCLVHELFVNVSETRMYYWLMFLKYA